MSVLSGKHQLGDIELSRIRLFLTLLVTLIAACGGPIARHGDNPKRVPPSDYSLAKLLAYTLPEYPLAALDAKREGSVIIAMIVAEDGAPDKLWICESSEFQDFDSLALHVAKSMAFKVAWRNDEPVEDGFAFQITFSMDSDGSAVTLVEAPYPQIEQPAEMIKEVPPVYPQLLRNQGIEGVVWVKALVGVDGNVSRAEVAKTCGVESLDNSAVKAAYLCKYKPGLQCGKPVAHWVTYKVDFVIVNPISQPKYDPWPGSR